MYKVHDKQLDLSVWILRNASLQRWLLCDSLVYRARLFGGRSWEELFWKTDFSHSDSISRAEYFQNIYWQHNLDDITEAIPTLLSCWTPQLNTAPMSTAPQSGLPEPHPTHRLLTTPESHCSLMLMSKKLFLMIYFWLEVLSTTENF
jgi:hypothetical protein